MVVRRLITHSGMFHADDVCATALLLRLFPGAEIVRTRDEGLMNLLRDEAVIYDVGMRHDPDSLAFDHHMKNAQQRDCGVTYSSFGLVWKHLGMSILSDLVAQEDAKEVFERFDEEFVLPIDMIDNGQLSITGIGVAGGITLSDVIYAMNPAFDAMSDDRLMAEFMRAVSFADVAITARISSISSDIRSARLVNGEIEAQRGSQILLLTFQADAQRAIDLADARHILAIVSPSSSGGWGVTVARRSADGLENVISMPESWGGLTGEELETLSGIRGLTFCHSALFYAAASSKEVALQVAKTVIRKHSERFGRG